MSEKDKSTKWASCDEANLEPWRGGGSDVTTNPTTQEYCWCKRCQNKWGCKCTRQQMREDMKLEMSDAVGGLYPTARVTTSCSSELSGHNRIGKERV